MEHVDAQEEQDIQIAIECKQIRLFDGAAARTNNAKIKSRKI